MSHASVDCEKSSTRTDFFCCRCVMRKKSFQWEIKSASDRKWDYRQKLIIIFIEPMREERGKKRAPAKGQWKWNKNLLIDAIFYAKA